MDLGLILNDKVDYSNTYIVIDDDEEYDVEYIPGEKAAETNILTGEEEEREEEEKEEKEKEKEDGEEETERENQQPKSSNKRKRHELEFGEVPDFDLHEHTKPKLDEPKVSLPEHTNPNKPNSIFSLFFSDDILKHIVDNSNNYAKVKIEEQKENQTPESQATEERPWTDLNIKELKIWIALVIYQGIYKSPELSDYWNTDPRFPIHNISKKMPLTRFEQIKRYLHISPNLEKPTYYYEKVNPLMDHVQSVSRQLYTPKTNVSLDEMIVQFKGRSKDTYRIKMKPTPQGYKIIALCDAGYTFAFYPTSISVKNDVPSIQGLTQTGELVYFLATKLDYYNFAYNVYMDNFFTSIALFKRLRALGIGACGTVKKPVVLSSDLLQKAKKVEWNTRAGFVEDGVLALFWKDNGPVTMLTTIHKFKGSDWEVSKKRRRPRLTSTNGKQVSEHYAANEHVKEFDIPRVIDDYNKNMNGVDIADQLRSYYNTHKTSRRTWMPLFFWLLDTSIVNSYRIAQLQKSKMPQKKFRKELSWELIMESIDEPLHLSNNIAKVPRILRNDYQPDKSRLIGRHIVRNISSARHCHLCKWKLREDIDPQGITCAKESMMYCETCDACFCVKNRDCFYDYHTKTIDHLKRVTR